VRKIEDLLQAVVERAQFFDIRVPEPPILPLLSILGLILLPTHLRRR
jgi:hypothetical protein